MQPADSRVVANRDISVTAGRSISMAGTALTHSLTGDVAYEAGQRLTIGQIAASDQLDGGRVRLSAPRVRGATGGEGIRAGFIDVDSAQVSEGALEQVVSSPFEVTRIVVNQRTAGGRLARDARFMHDLLVVSDSNLTPSPSSTLHDSERDFTRLVVTEMGVTSPGAADQY